MVLSNYVILYQDERLIGLDNRIIIISVLRYINIMMYISCYRG